MLVFKCKMCGGTLEVNNNETVGVCEYCGTKQTLPKLDNERKMNLYDRANHFRRNDEFDKAMSIYEQILNEDRTDAESYWSIVLCRYGIEYVEDPTTHKRIPTVNRAQFTSIFDDEDYKSALQYADGYQREIYESEATVINEIQKGILAISQKEEPFDVFICYKETDKNGRRTQDSVLAQELYYELLEEGFKVFFAKITFEDKLGQEYEPYIFAALNSAKVMVALGTKPEHFNAVWVKNEWSRYLALIKKGENKMLIPAYRDMDPYDLPEEFSHLQAQDMSKLGFMQDLVRGIKKIVQVDVTDTVEKTPVVISGNSNTSALLRRAYIFLEDGDWESAEEYCEKVLDLEPENARAYLGKLMVELKVKKQEDLKDCAKPFDEENNYQKVLRFADATLASTLKEYNVYIKERNENARLEGVYTGAVDKMQSARKERHYKSAAEAFYSIKEYKDSKALYERCLEQAEIARKDGIYTYAKTRMVGDILGNYEEAIHQFQFIPDWKDSQEQIIECQRKIEEIKEENKRKKKKRTLIGILSILVAVAIMTFIIILNTVIIPSNKYKEAIEAMEKNNYDDAIVIFEELGDYKNSQEYLKETKYIKALKLMDNGEYSQAYYLQAELRNYKDVNQLLENFTVLPAKIVASGDNAHYIAEYSYDSAGNCVKEERDSETIDYYYDGNGKCTKEVRKSEFSNSTCYYTYDEYGRCIKREELYDGYTHTYLFTYDVEGNCIKEVCRPSSGNKTMTEYSYDSNGNCVKEIYYGMLSSEPSVTEYSYDDKGNCIKETKTSEQSKGTTEYSYDSYGNCIKEVYTSMDGSYYYSYEYSYNIHNDLIKEVENKSDGEQRITEYKYEDYQIFYHPKQ